MIRAIKKRRGDLIAVIGLFVIAIGVGGYILDNQRMRFPLIEDKPFEVKAEFATAQAVTPGQGQTVRVAGIRVGDIAKTELKNGRSIITMALDSEYDDLVRKDATALLRPKTGLKDMFIELNPGTSEAPVADEGWTMPISTTLPDVNPDEFLSALDADTRDYLKLLLNGAGKGLKGNGKDLREVLARFEPTHRDLAKVSTEVATRRRELRRLINALQRLNTKLAGSDEDLSQLIESSNRVFRALAAEREGVQGTVRELPGALRETRDSLEKVEAMARVLRPTADRLRPVAGALKRANDATLPFAKEATPQLRDDVRPFVREARPLLRELLPAVDDLVTSEPQLKRSLKVLNHLFNMLGHNPNGREAPGVAGRDEGYAFALAWLSHISVNLFSTADANGPMRNITLAGACNVFESSVASVPASEFILGLTGVLTDPRICGGDGAAARRATAKKQFGGKKAQG
ncbi:MlaD family protein [Paraconexibacter sp.]|uniref:MlaD family protein n=1 Tax=Paraconexibacter sp. TaxID=2949640 RepID=UPI0035658567